MRDYPQDDSDKRDIEHLEALSWQVEALKMNPDYNSWGPGEDYMYGDSEKRGWSGSVYIDTWDAFDWSLDDLNEVVNFHFEIQRDSQNCVSCGGSGLNSASTEISRAFYDFEKTGKRWCDRITQDEIETLVRAGRLSDFMPHWYRFDDERGWLVLDRTGNPPHEWCECEKPEMPLASQVNARSNVHDAINRWILIEARCKRLGVWGECDYCDGHGYHYIEPFPRLALVLWVIHPRKGASRGVEIKEIEQEQLPLAVAYLQEAAARNAARFSGLNQGGYDSAVEAARE